MDYVWDSTTFRIEGSDGIGYVRLGDGKCLVAPQWKRIDVDRLNLPGDAEPYGHIFIVWKDGHCGLILDDEGMIIPPVWDEIIPRRFEFDDPLSYSVRKGQHWGICDARGHLICDAVWDETDIFQKGTACVKKDGRWGVIGADGQICVPTEWDEIEGFGIRNSIDDAFARTNTGALLGVRRCTYTTLPSCFSWVKRNGFWGLIDRNGAIVAEPIWEYHDGAFARRFEEGWQELTVCRNRTEANAVAEDETIKLPEALDYHIEIRKVDQE